MSVLELIASLPLRTVTQLASSLCNTRKTSQSEVCELNGAEAKDQDKVASARSGSRRSSRLPQSFSLSTHLHPAHDPALLA